MPTRASGTLKSAFSLCLSFFTVFLPVSSVPVPIDEASPQIPRSLEVPSEPRAVANKCGGMGVYITNGGSSTQSYSVFGGGSTFLMNSDLYHSVTLAGGKSAPVTLPPNFTGHVQRGGLLPATWVELNMVPGGSDGDVSLESGCDGAVTVQASAISSGGAPPVFGFSKDIISAAPADAFFNRATSKNPGGTETTSTRVLDASLNNANTLKYEQSVLSQSQAYLVGGVGTSQAIASDSCILMTFY